MKTEWRAERWFNEQLSFAISPDEPLNDIGIELNSIFVKGETQSAMNANNGETGYICATIEKRLEDATSVSMDPRKYREDFLSRQVKDGVRGEREE